MTLVALEEHVLPAQYADIVWTDQLPPAIVGSTQIREYLADISDRRLPAMDAAGIDMQVLSSVAPAAQASSPEDSVKLARSLNDTIAAIMAQHPTRFQALAALPTPDPAAAAREAQRAIRDLGMCGVIIQGHTQGRFLDSAEFEPMLAAIEELGVPMYLHPTFPPKAVADVYYAGLDDAIAGPLSTAAWGWHAETGLHVLRMAAGGVFTRHPGLRVVVGHMGENLPFSLARADAVLSAALGAGTISDLVREHVYVTICGYTTLPPFQCALAVFGTDHMLFSVDYPFGDAMRHAQFLAQAPISPTDREKIGYLNAERLFGLSVGSAKEQ
jgi:predicted TIM-barrel fold metal-dependent hydrolase